MIDFVWGAWVIIVYVSLNKNNIINIVRERNDKWERVNTITKKYLK